MAVTWVGKGLRALRLGGSGTGWESQSQRLYSAQPPPIGVPPKPKKPLTPYFRFMTQVREDVKRQNPNLKVTDLMKKVAQQWDKLDEAQKTPYTSSFKKDLESYNATMERYQRSLSPEQQAFIQQTMLEKQVRKEKKERKKRIKELGRPKKPTTAFLAYLRSKMSSGSSMKEYQDMAKQLAVQWKSMSEKEKAPWAEKYKDEYAQYERELKRWEEKMIKQGNEDVVRIGHLQQKVRGTKAQSR